MFERLKKLVRKEDPPMFNCVYASPDVMRGQAEPRPQEEKVLQDSIIVGRGRDVDVSINDMYVSRRHCQIRREKQDGSYSIRDLNALGGTYVNDKRIGMEWTPLKPGDVIGLVHNRYSFEMAHEKLQTIWFRREQKLEKCGDA